MISKKLNLISNSVSLDRRVKEEVMSRTVVDLRDDLIRKARKLTGLTKKVQIVNLALERLVQQKELEEFMKLKGTVKWTGVLKKMRRNRFDFGREFRMD